MARWQVSFCTLLRLHLIIVCAQKANKSQHRQQGTEQKGPEAGLIACARVHEVSCPNKWSCCVHGTWRLLSSTDRLGTSRHVLKRPTAAGSIRGQCTETVQQQLLSSVPFPVL